MAYMTSNLRSTVTAPPPLVSIVTPSYNQAQFIEQTIRSVARQQYSKVEHIIVDGESTDETVDILREYDNQLKWISEKDEGQSDAINKGFEMANGEIVAWLNSDDVLFDIYTLNRVVNYFERYGTDIVYGDVALLNKDSDVLKLQLVPDFDYEKLLLKCFIEQPSLFFRGGLVRKERLDTTLEYVMDYDFWLRLAQDYTFRHVPDVLAGDRNHAQRKILNHRGAMRKEAEKVRAEYGGPTGVDRDHQLRKDLLTSGIPRALHAVPRTRALHHSSPPLAFDGTLRPLYEMVLNIGRLNRNLK